MKSELANKSEIKLIGLSVRTNNRNELNEKTAKIGELIGRYQAENIPARISDQTNPNVTLSVYTEYDSDEHGDYTYFIGAEVNTFANIPPDLQKLIIPAAKYRKFTTDSGKMPDIVIQAWQQIWQMSPSDFGGKRAYRADFEVYDERAYNPTNTTLDIYIGIA